MADAPEPLYHWSDGDGAYPTETWCGIPFYLDEPVPGSDDPDATYMVPNPALGGESLAYVIAEEGARHVTCPDCIQMLVEEAVLDMDMDEDES